MDDQQNLQPPIPPSAPQTDQPFPPVDPLADPTVEPLVDSATDFPSGDATGTVFHPQSSSSNAFVPNDTFLNNASFTDDEQMLPPLDVEPQLPSGDEGFQDASLQQMPVPTMEPMQPVDIFQEDGQDANNDVNQQVIQDVTQDVHGDVIQNVSANVSTDMPADVPAQTDAQTLTPQPERSDSGDMPIFDHPLAAEQPLVPARPLPGLANNDDIDLAQQDIQQDAQQDDQQNNQHMGSVQEQPIASMDVNTAPQFGAQEQPFGVQEQPIQEQPIYEQSTQPFSPAQSELPQDNGSFAQPMQTEQLPQEPTFPPAMNEADGSSWPEVYQAPGQENASQQDAQQADFSANPPVEPHPSTGVDQQNNQPQPAFQQASVRDVQKSPFRFLPLLLGLLVFLGVIGFAASKFLSGSKQSAGTADTGTTQPAQTSTKQTTITYWGLWESSTVMEGVIADFEKQNPTIKVQYVQQSPKDYRERLQEALKKGDAPDVFRYHATWVPMLLQQLAVVPSTVMTPSEFEQTFYPVMATDLKTQNGYVGIPLMYDGLALFYNVDMLQAANIKVPETWSDLETAAQTLRVPQDPRSKIERAGVALGLTSNVDNYSDIVALLLLQNGANPADLSTTYASDAFTYYTNFYKKYRVWDETLPNSTYAFATEKVAMILAPSWRAFEIKSINPKVNFAIARAPQLPNTNVAWASYWVEGVSKNSKQKDAAWTLLKYMSSKEVMQKMYSDASSKTPRLFGEIYSRKDMASLLSGDTYAAAFVKDAPIAKSWYMASRTHDNGINDKIIKYVEDAINAIVTSKMDIKAALATAQQGILQVLSMYGIK